MSFFDRLFGMMGGHHGGYGRGGKHGGYGGYGPPGGMPPEGGAPPGLICPGCGTASPVGTRFCGQCGTSFAPAKCGSCGAGMAAGVKFCPQCGKPRA
jgi:predicted amidophosphoribosyltransferase